MSGVIKFIIGVILICFIVDCNSKFIDTLSKCGVKDYACQVELVKSAFQQIAKTGIPEKNIPGIDPFYIKDVTVSIPGLVSLTMVDGVVKGVKDCDFTDYILDVETGRARQVILCNITVKGHYRVNASSLIESALGGSEVHGEGNAKVKIDKLQLEYNYPFYLERKDDGEIYYDRDYSKTEQKFDILGKVTFAADNIFIGKEDVSELVVSLLNQYSRFIMKTFGQKFIDKASEFRYLYENNFFSSVPAKYYISDDLTPYLKE